MCDELETTQEIPNAETLAAFAEIENGGGIKFTGTIDEFVTELLAEDEPTAETKEAMEELLNGGGYRYTGTTEEIVAELLKPD